MDGWKEGIEGERTKEATKEARRKEWLGKKRRERDELAFLSGKSILKGNFTRISSWFFFFFYWSHSARRLQKVGMSRGCWILLWLIYDCQRRSREIMHVWSRKTTVTCNTHTHIHRNTHWKCELVWWVAPSQMFCPLLDLSRALHCLPLQLYDISRLFFLCYLLSFSWFLLFFLFPTFTVHFTNTHTHCDLTTSCLGSGSGRKPQPFQWISIPKCHGVTMETRLPRSTSCNHNVTSRARRCRASWRWQCGCS